MPTSREASPSRYADRSDMLISVRSLILAFTLAPLVACSTQSASNTAAEVGAASQPGTSQPGAPPPVGKATGQAQSPEGAPASSDAAPRTITGRVVETMDAASYTYVRVDTGSEEVWAAASQFPVKVGERVSVALDFPMKNFHSNSLNRDFPVIYFVSKVGRDGEAPGAPGAPAAAQLPPGHAPVSSHGESAAVTAPAAGEIKPVEGGLTIADVWAKRVSLAGKSVTVRGKVMKVNNGIMGRNWIHVQDGSGKASDGTNDLTLTSDAVVRVGDVITATGTVAVDKDFTAGYKYGVIVEGVKLSAK